LSGPVRSEVSTGVPDGRTVDGVMQVQWWSVEVRDGVFSAHRWRDAHGEALIEAALTHGVREWHWSFMEFGVVLELAFADTGDWRRFRGLPAVTAALDAVPDPIMGLYVYPGRGGSAGAGLPRRTPSPCGAGAAALPETPEPLVVARPAQRQLITI
jgi:hypothetical protein